MNPRFFTILFGFSLLCLPDSLQARPYDCGNGRLQQYPCQYSYEELTSGAVRGSTEQGPSTHDEIDTPRARLKPTSSSLLYEDTLQARVLEAKFLNLQNGRGRWVGKISGEGHIYLYLDFYRGDDLIESRSMGSTDARRDEGSVSFSFESQLPSRGALMGEKLEWKVRALLSHRK